MRSLAAQLAAAEVALNVSWARRDALAEQLAIRRWAHGLNAASRAPAPRPEQPKHPPTPAPSSPEWNIERVRNVLLWTGAALLAFAALAFTAVAWTHLGPGGRAELLIAITIAASAAAVATRNRLPATSGALTGLSIALALIDWQIGRRAGVASGLSGPMWWAIGTATVAVASVGLGRIAAPTPAYRAVALLAPASAVLALTSSVGSAWGVALGISAIVATLVSFERVTSDRVLDPVVRAIVHIETGIGWTVGVVIVVLAASEPHTLVQSATPAAVMLAFAVGPGLCLVRPTAPTRHRIVLASAVLAVLLGSVLTLGSTSAGPIGLMTIAAVLGAGLMAASPSLSDVWRRAAQLIAAFGAGPGVVFAVGAASVAVLGPIAWLHHAWTGTMTAHAASVVAGPHTHVMPDLGWCAVAILLAVAVAIRIGARAGHPTAAPSSQPAWRSVGAGLALLAIVLVPIASGASALVACVVTCSAMVTTLVGAAFVTPRARRGLSNGLLALVPGVSALGWAALTSTASITVLAGVAFVALIATAVGRVPSLRAAHAALGTAASVTLGAVILLAAGASVQSAGFAAATVAGMLVVMGSQMRRDTADGIALEVVGGLGMLAGVVLASRSAAWAGGTLTAVVSMLLAARLRGHRSVLYAVSGGFAAVGATWAWLAAAGVSVPEAYTLPAATAGLVAGRLAYRDGPARSWLNYGPALGLFLGPTLVLAIARNDDTRAIAVGLASLAIVLIGARQRLQAPIVLAAVILVVIGLDKLGPTAVRLPRWIMLTFAGLVLLWVGSTFERRRDNAQRVVRRFERFG